MWVIYCTLVNVWVSGRSGDKIKYSTNREDAVLYKDRENAEKVWTHLPYIWKPHCQIVRYTESTQIHDEYFAEQDRYYAEKSVCDIK